MVLRSHYPDSGSENNNPNQNYKEKAFMIDSNFKSAVKQMRFCQKEFFKNKNYYSLENAKHAEKIVDHLIEQDDEAEKAQLKLFPEEQH